MKVTIKLLPIIGNSLFLILTCLVFFSAKANDWDWDRVVNLKGYWRFELGDNQAWANPQYNDEKWEKLYVPAYWEEEGFDDYNGFAWYRKNFNLDEVDSRTLALFLGYIDDVDQVYINGKLVGGSGSFPPDYASAYDFQRRYLIPNEYLNEGENLIAVRIYDNGGWGGIDGRKIGIYANDEIVPPAIDLTGLWKFHLFDDDSWKNPQLDDSEWENLMVPGYWEHQGYYGYNGFAWYRRKVIIPESFEGEQLILSLGKIDDLDEVFFNGEKIGFTGEIDRYRIHGYEWQEVRGYYIPKDVIKLGKENLIAIRVYDGMGDGGIYQGPIGIFVRDEYVNHWRKYHRKNRHWWDYFENWY